MKNLAKIFTIAVLVFTMPVTTSNAAVPDLPVVYNSGNNGIVAEAPAQASLATDLGIKPMSPMDYTPTAFAARFVQMLPAIDAAVKDSLGIQDLAVPSGDEVVTSPETQDIMAEQERQGFWTKQKLWLIGRILLLTALGIGLVAMLASGSGSGSGSGAGGPGPGGTSPLNNNGGGGDGGNGGGSGGTGGSSGGGLFGAAGLLGGGSGGQGADFPGGVPHNPEPSTFLLAGLGLLIPRLRKRSK